MDSGRLSWNVTGAAELRPSAVAGAGRERRLEMLRQASQEMVGATFFAPMLKMARESVLKGRYGHGGRGEEIFRAQLDDELARRASLAMDNSLSDAICRRLAGRVTE